MKPLKYTLIADGPTDQTLLYVLDWLLRQHDMTPERQFFDPRKMYRPPTTLAEKICAAQDQFPCEVLFIHRDAETSSSDVRRGEIAAAIRSVDTPPHVCVIPVRMTEAWFLFDQVALRRAAGKPNGTASLCLPRCQDVESHPDPKNTLVKALRQASGLTGRGLRKFNENAARYRLAELIQDFTPLRTLTAFQRLEQDIVQLLAQQAVSPMAG